MANNPVQSLCPEFEMRAAMTDTEFWDHVLNPPLPTTWDTEPSTIDIDDIVSFSHLGSPCPECGSIGACAYDQEGRAMIHATSKDDNE